MVESKALTATVQGWLVDEEQIRGLQSSADSGQILVRRLAHLAVRDMTFLVHAAVLGIEFSPEHACELSGIEAADVQPILAGLQKRNLLWRVQGSTNLFRFCHAQIRSAALERLNLERRREIHLAAAELLERQGGDHNEELAYHFSQAGVPQKAITYALVAAERARVRNSLERAVEQYRIAEASVSENNLRLKFRIAEGLGAHVAADRKIRRS